MGLWAVHSWREAKRVCMGWVAGFNGLRPVQVCRYVKVGETAAAVLAWHQGYGCRWGSRVERTLAYRFSGAVQGYRHQIAVVRRPGLQQPSGSGVPLLLLLWTAAPCAGGGNPETHVVPDLALLVLPSQAQSAIIWLTRLHLLGSAGRNPTPPTRFLIGSVTRRCPPQACDPRAPSNAIPESFCC